MNPLAIISIIKGQPERVVWVLIAMSLGLWLWNTASDVGELRAQVKYQEQAMGLMSEQLNSCLDSIHGRSE